MSHLWYEGRRTICRQRCDCLRWSRSGRRLGRSCLYRRGGCGSATPTLFLKGIFDETIAERVGTASLDLKERGENPSC